MPLLQQTKGPIRPYCDIQKHTKTLLPVAQTEVAVEGSRSSHLTHRWVRISLCVYREYLWILPRDNSQAPLANRGYNWRFRNRFTRQCDDPFPRTDQHCNDCSRPLNHPEDWIHFKPTDAKVKLAPIPRGEWIKIYAWYLLSDLNKSQKCASRY